MDITGIMYVVKLITLVLCWLNYGLCLYRNKWDFTSMESVGWLMAVLGWTNVVL